MLCVDKFSGSLLWTIGLITSNTMLFLSIFGITELMTIWERLAVCAFLLLTYSGFARIVLTCVRLVLTNMEKERNTKPE